jgi:hypothetical protein
MSDLLFQNISTVQSKQQPLPVSIASATTIAPTTFVTFITGTTLIQTITPPVTGAHMLALVFSSAQSGQFGTTGNIQQSTTTATANVPVYMVYDPRTAKYYYKT